MIRGQDALEFPFWQALAYAVIGQAARDYIESLMVLNGQRIGQTAMTYDVRAHPERMQEDAEVFFFSGYFRVLACDSGMDGMRLAEMIEENYLEMYRNMQKAKSGRPIRKDVGILEDPKEKKRRMERERYRKRKEARMAARAAG